MHTVGVLGHPEGGEDPRGTGGAGWALLGEQGGKSSGGDAVGWWEALRGGYGGANGVPWVLIGFDGLSKGRW